MRNVAKHPLLLVLLTSSRAASLRAQRPGVDGVAAGRCVAVLHRVQVAGRVVADEDVVEGEHEGLALGSAEADEAERIPVRRGE